MDLIYEFLSDFVFIYKFTVVIYISNCIRLISIKAWKEKYGSIKKQLHGTVRSVVYLGA